jgi:hypothetical protein
MSLCCQHLSQIGLTVTHGPRVGLIAALVRPSFRFPSPTSPTLGASQARRYTNRWRTTCKTRTEWYAHTGYSNENDHDSSICAVVWRNRLSLRSALCLSQKRNVSRQAARSKGRKNESSCR